MISVASLKAHLRVTHTADDVYIAELEEAAVGFVERWTGDFYGPEEEVTEIVPGTGLRALWLAQAPAGSPVVVTIDETSYPGATATAIADVDDDGFEVRSRKLVRKGGGGWVRGYEYEVTYTRGYAEGAQPEPVRHAVKMLVAHWYHSRTPVAAATVAANVPLTVSSLLGGPRPRA